MIIAFSCSIKTISVYGGLMVAAAVISHPHGFDAYAQVNEAAPLIEAEQEPKSILFPAGVPGPFFPSDEEIAKAAEQRLNPVVPSDPAQADGTLTEEAENNDTVILDTPDPAAYGTLSERTTGLAKTIWQPSEIDNIEKLLSVLSLPSTSPAMDEIARKLLLTVATAPSGTAIVRDPTEEDEDLTPQMSEPPFDEELLKSFINLRLDKLIERGNLSDLVAYIQNLPQGTMVPNQQNAEILMLGGDLISACRMTHEARRLPAIEEDNRLSSNQPTVSDELDGEELFWLRMLAFCRVLENDNAGAQIAMDMLGEQGQVDFIFTDLLGRLMEEPDMRGRFMGSGLTTLEPLNYTILSLLDQTINADLIEASSPLIISALVINPNMPSENRFQAAVKSYGYGGISAQRLRNIYSLQEFTDMEHNNAIRMAEFDNRPIADALLYQAALKQAGDLEKAQLLDVIWRRAQENNDLPRKAALNLEALVSLNPTTRLMNYAHHIARGLIIGGDTARAIQWYDFTRRAAVSGDAEATRALINIWPLAVIAADAGEIPWSEDIINLWWNGQMVLSPENRDTKASLFYAVAEAFEYPVSEARWQELISENQLQNVRSIPLAVWRELIRAVGEDKQAKAIILSLIAMGNEGPGSLDPSGLSTVIRLLRSFGMEQEARQVALEALIANDF